MDTGHNSSVLITGGRGSIGRAATKLLQRTGYAVISLDVSSLTDAAHDQQSVRKVLCAIADGQALHQVFEAGAIDVIFQPRAGPADRGAR
jgi:nucleoside-diphosphate-sugar epimerase